MARMSRADGTVTQVFESNNDYDKNLKLARVVVGYGHKSIAEHDYIVFALEDVTPIVEQIIIGYRLTSFTIKSRRNVDFRNVGFYVPDFHDKDGKVLKNNKTLQKQYKAYMQSLFDKYGAFSLIISANFSPSSFTSGILEILPCNISAVIRNNSFASQPIIILL